MRRMLVVVGFAVVATLLAACAPAAAPAPTPTKAPAPTPKPKVEAPAPKPAAPAEPKKMALGTSQTASSHYVYRVAVAKVFNTKVPEVSVTPVETGASVENLTRMVKGEMEIGALTDDLRYQAYHGVGDWKGKAAPDVRLLWVYIVNPCPPIVREDSGVKRMEDLEGKDFNPGMRGSSTEAQTKRYLEVLGIKPKWYIGGTDDALAAIKDRRIVGFTKCTPSAGSVDSAVLDLMVSTPIRMLPLTPEHITKIKAEVPWFSVGNIEAGVYKADWNKDPIPSLGLIVDMSVMKRLPDDLAYKFTKAGVEDNRPGWDGIQATAWPAVKGLDFAKQTMETATTPLHVGALKYYRELGLKIKSELIPPEAK